MTSTNPAAERHMTATSAAELLADRFDVARVSGDRIFLAVPASAMVAADWLRKRGFDAVSDSDGQWHVRVLG